eukprot:m.204183 g.204183  ORF g.204183 m.204183 type:complete len:443 (-) comp53862_c0_seq4:306-1634(-)
MTSSEASNRRVRQDGELTDLSWLTSLQKISLTMPSVPSAALPLDFSDSPDQPLPKPRLQHSRQKTMSCPAAHRRQQKQTDPGFSELGTTTVPPQFLLQLPARAGNVATTRPDEKLLHHLPRTTKEIIARLEMDLSAILRDCNDTDKPAVPMACLIALAIAQAPEQRLSVGDIYLWIKEKFDYFRLNDNAGWKNSVRHNLSLSKCFLRVQDSPSLSSQKVTSSLWAIDPRYAMTLRSMLNKKVDKRSGDAQKADGSLSACREQGIVRGLPRARSYLGTSRTSPVVSSLSARHRTPSVDRRLRKLELREESHAPRRQRHSSAPTGPIDDSMSSSSDNDVFASEIDHPLPYVQDPEMWVMFEDFMKGEQTPRSPEWTDDAFDMVVLPSASDVFGSDLDAFPAEVSEELVHDTLASPLFDPNAEDSVLAFDSLPFEFACETPGSSE